MLYLNSRRFRAFAFILATAPTLPFASDRSRSLPVGGPLSLESTAAPSVLFFKITNTGPFAVVVHVHHGKTPQDSQQAFELLGGAKQEGRGQWAESGVPAHFRVKIARTIDSMPVFSAEAKNPGTSAGYQSRWAKLAEPTLAPGEYTMEVTGSTSSSELRRMRMDVFATPATHGK
jgi:hypothetical protein